MLAMYTIISFHIMVINVHPFFEAYTLLSAVAAITTKLRVGQVVTCNSYRLPSLLAKMSSTLDAISNGRLEFGIGAGWFEHEYNSYGYPFGTPEILQSKIEMLKIQCKKIHRNFDEIENSVLLRVLVGKDKDDIKHIVTQLKKKNESISEFIMRSKDSIALGTPDEVIEYLHKYVNIGISYFIVNFIGLSNSL